MPYGAGQSVPQTAVPSPKAASAGTRCTPGLELLNIRMGILNTRIGLARHPPLNKLLDALNATECGHQHNPIIHFHFSRFNNRYKL